MMHSVGFQVRFPYILLSELTAALSAPQWETLNASPKSQELIEQATEVSMEIRSRFFLL